MIPIKKLQSLYWAEIHMRETRDAAAHLLTLGNIGPELSHSIYTGIVVGYSRSFGANQGLSAIGDEFRGFTEPRFQTLHDFLLEARNTLYAHKDVKREGDRLPAGLPREDLRKIRIHIAASGESHWLVQRPSLPARYLEDIIALCEFQIARINAASTAILQNGCKGKGYKAGDYVLGETFP